MSELWDSFTNSLGNLKKKITGVASNPTPSPITSNAMSMGGGKRSGGKRSRSKRSRSKRRGGKRSSSMCSGGKRSRGKKTKKVRFSKKHKIYTYRRHSRK